MATISTTPPNQDIISVRNIQLPTGITAPDVWGKHKDQPALISVTLVLRNPFASAASKDALDESTIHYGKLSKRIRAACSSQGQTLETVASCAQDVVDVMATKGDGRDVLARDTVEVHLPKASMYGDGVTLSLTGTHAEGDEEPAMETVFVVEGLKLMLLVGVNGYERSAKQPIIARLWLTFWDDAEDCDAWMRQTALLFKLEKTLVEITQDSSFETLESLADFTIKQLQQRLLNEALPGSQVRLRLEKPRAIAFAEAPAVEVCRITPGSVDSERASPVSKTINDNGDRELRLVKPYV